MATIELTNDVLLDSSSLKTGIDGSNVLTSTTNASYLATQDWWVRIYLNESYGTDTFKIDDVALFAGYNASRYAYCYCKKGQTVSRNGTKGGTMTVYGTK